MLEPSRRADLCQFVSEYDSGVNIDHVELEGRAKWGKTIPKDPDQDLNGHGSHVAVSFRQPYRFSIWSQ